MAKSTDKISLPQTWIAPSFVWTVEPDVFLVEVSVSDQDIVEFISTGVLDVTPKYEEMSAARGAAKAANDPGTLRYVLGIAVWDPALKRQPAVSPGSPLYAYCHGVFRLPGGSELCTAVGWSEPCAPEAWIATELRREVDTLFLAN